MVEQLFGPQEDVPDLYVDSVRIGVGPYGFVFELGVARVADTEDSEKPPPKRQALVRMSPQHALIFSKILQRNVALYQERMGKINLPEGLYKELGLEPE